MARISQKSSVTICYGLIDIPNMAKNECKIFLMFKQLMSPDNIYLVFLG